MGVRTNVPFRDLSDAEKAIVYEGPPRNGTLSLLPRPVVRAGLHLLQCGRHGRNALAKAKDEGSRPRGQIPHHPHVPACDGTRWGSVCAPRSSRASTWAEASRLMLLELREWVQRVPGLVPNEVAPMARVIVEEMTEPMIASCSSACPTCPLTARPRRCPTVSASACSSPVPYATGRPGSSTSRRADHRPAPANVDGVLAIIRELIADGNSVVVVDHDTRVLAAADHLIEIGPGAGQTVVASSSRAPSTRPPRPASASAGMAGVRRVERAAGSRIEARILTGAVRFTWRLTRSTRCGPGVDIPLEFVDGRHGRQWVE